MAAEPPAPPARDLGFVVAVMKRIEQRRLMENLSWLFTVTVAGTALLFLVMPYITPALTTIGHSLWPEVIAAAAVLCSLYGFDQARRVFGWRLF
ncbi:MAG: hypothetical protein QM647_07495 [Asticcacaulis sp.]|uniref:hypothetical protein n=1 Tax=Asticcacaulis sp. TaxID=1872648 RepID=UPI0039E46A3A